MHPCAGGTAVRVSGTVHGQICRSAPGSSLEKLTKAQKEALCAEWAEKNLPRLSLATRADAAEILDIYNWYVLHHTATFQVTPSSLPEYEDWVDSTVR